MLIHALGLNPFWVAVFAIGILYILLIGDWFHRAWAALGMALAVTLVGVLPYNQALASIDVNTMMLLIGMMILVGLLGEAGLFVYLGHFMKKWTRGSPRRLMWIIYGMTAVASAFLDNVTTVLLLSPALFQIAESMSLDPVPLLMVMVVASNLGGMATLIGDPPNILIGTAAGLTFNQFVYLLLPGALVVLGGLAWLLPGSLAKSQPSTTPAAPSKPVSALVLRPRLNGLLVILGLTLLAFVFQGALGVDAGDIAVASAVFAALYSWLPLKPLITFVDWGTLGFFVGIFVLVRSLEQHGVASFLAGMINSRQWGPWLPLVLFLGAAVFSALLDNVPLVAAAIPIIRSLLQQNPHLGNTLWVALAMGAAIGGNATIIGASANVVAQGLALERGYALDFKRYLPFGAKIFGITLVLATCYILIRF